MSALVEELLAHNRAYAAAFRAGELSRVPRKKLVVVACMDARLDVFAALGLQVGDAHIIRNAGGIVTEDVLRSLVVSQRYLDTNEIIILAHTDCGMTTFTDDMLKGQIEAETGVRPSFSFEPFGDPDAAIRRSVQRLRNDPFILHRDAIRGFVYDVSTGLLREVMG